MASIICPRAAQRFSRLSSSGLIISRTQRKPELLSCRGFASSAPSRVPIRPLITHGDTAPGYWQIGNLWKVMATGVQTNNSFTLLDQIVHAGPNKTGGPQTHTHTQDEGLYVVSGQCTFNAGGIHGMVAGPGTFVNIPRLTEHSFSVNHPDTQLLNFYLPAGFEQMLIGVAHPADTNTPPPPGVPLPPHHLVDILAVQYGQTPVLGAPFKDPPNPDKMATRPLPGATVFPYIETAAGSPAYWYNSGLWSVLANSAQTAKSYDIIEVILPKGAGFAPRIYDGIDEVFYILDGEVQFLLEDRIEVAGKGALVFIPRGSVAAYRVKSETAKFLNLHTPGGFERILETMGEVAGARSLPSKKEDRAVAKETKELIQFELGLRTIAVGDPLK